MKRIVSTSLLLGVGLLFSLDAQAAVTVLWSQRTTVDSDGDAVPDLFDSAPGAFNPFQEDADMDQIGDVIDPTPSTSVPNLGDPGLGMNGPISPLPPGSTAIFDYLMFYAVPPGAFGHIDLDFGGNGIYDATYFGPLTANFLQFSVLANLFVDSTWDLNTAGFYLMYAKAYGPGMSSANVTINGVTITPEPTTCALALIGLLSTLRRCR